MNRAIITEDMSKRLWDSRTLRTVAAAVKRAKRNGDNRTLKAFVLNGARKQTVRKCRAYIQGEEFIGFYCQGKIFLNNKQYGEDDSYIHESDTDGVFWVY